LKQATKIAGYSGRRPMTALTTLGLAPPDTIKDVSPNTADGWLKVGDIHADAAGTLRAAGRAHIALYLAGYYVECNAKAVCMAGHRRPPATGSAGHDLVALLEIAGIRLSDLQTDWRRFMERRRVDLRYEEGMPPDIEGPEMYEAGHALGSYLRRLARRQARRARR
jgi:hypothetical protein